MAKGGSKKPDIYPLGDRVLVRPLSPEDLATKSPSGIIIPDTIDKEKPEQGTVIAVGNGRMSDTGDVIPLRVKKGDRILFSKYGYDDVKVEGEEYYILREEQILAVIK